MTACHFRFHWHVVCDFLSMRYTIQDFFKQYPDDDSCLEDLFQRRFGQMEKCPKCGEKFRYHRVKKRKCYECGSCANQIYPLSGTIMEGSTTSIQSWYYAIYLFSQSKNGVSAKELERQLGVTYKTAWRMGHKIREVMSKEDSKEQLTGIVEVDESMYGGKAKGKRGWGAENKTILFGMVERNGKVKVVTVKNRHQKTLVPIMNNQISKKAVVHTDKYRVYKQLPRLGYKHHIKNNKDVFTNCIEGYWGNFKKSILGTHTWVSEKHLQSYLDEFAFRHNNRKISIFEMLLGII